MPDGTIDKFENTYGFIRRDERGGSVFFHVSNVQGLSKSQLVPGTRVYYEEEVGPRGPRARVVRPVPTEPRGPQPDPQRGYRFLNPYNFVRPLRVQNTEQAPLLGRCPPPPHDRYVGLTGRLRCTLTATTPLFVADAQGVEPDPEKEHHYHYRFFRDPEGTLAIPATSLRGSIRSVFEAVTNSCFSVFAAYKRLSYHLQPEEALKLVPARVVQDHGQWYLELLTGTTLLAPGQKPQGPQYAAWIHAYRPLLASRTQREAPDRPYSRRRTISLSGWKHGDPCQAIVEEMEHPRRHFRFWNVVRLARPGTPLKAGPGERLVSGYMCLTNQNIENKHDERLFFFDGAAPHRIGLEASLRKRYHELIADYQDRHEDEVAKHPKRGAPSGRNAALSWFVCERTGKDDEKLQPGDLVYAMVRRDGQQIKAEFIVPVSVPRVGYDQTIGERLEPGTSPEQALLHKCHQLERLCPACRTFGWVWGTGDPEEKAPADETVPLAYAGRVRFSHAELKHSAGTLDEMTLAILSTPKPTTTRFYLKPANDREPLRDGQEDQQVDYSEAANRQLRGRKFYRHHGAQLSPDEYPRAFGERDDQNRTVHDVQQAGSTFEFSIEFENLQEIELGALLWSVEMEGWNHRFGMGKPLGFGSATIRIDELDLVQLPGRHTRLELGWSTARENKDRWIEAFKNAMAARYGEKFQDLANVRDLRALLSASPDLPVHYPRPTRKPQREGRNYEWFVGNKRSGRNAGPRKVLPLAEDDTTGLPLIDRFGEIAE